MTGEVRQPNERGPKTLHVIQQHDRPRDPLERVEAHDGVANDRRNQKTRDQAHVVVKRQPTRDDIARRRADRGSVEPDLFQDRVVRQHDPFFEARCSGTVLQKRRRMGRFRQVP